MKDLGPILNYSTKPPGTEVDIENTNLILNPGLFRDFILTPLLIIATPAIIMGIFFHYITVAITERISFKTYFATHLVIGGAFLNKNLANKHREFLEGLTSTKHSTLETIDRINRKDQNMAVNSLINDAQSNQNTKTDTSSTPLSENEVMEGRKYLEIIGKCQKIKENVHKSLTLSFEEVTIEGTNAKLDGFAIRTYKQEIKQPEEQKWIIFFPGRRTSWELWHNCIIELAKKTGVNVLTINYRGVMRSGRTQLNDPSSPQEVTNSAKMLKEDAAAAVNHLVNMGISKDNILNFGYSLGGGAASTQTDIGICSDRSFKSLSAASIALAYFPVFRHVMGLMTKYIFGDINSYENVRQIQKNKSQAYILTSKQDAIIDIKHASLFSAFQEQEINNTPPTVLIHYDEKGQSDIERLRMRINAHIAAVPDAVVHLIKDWLQDPTT